MVNFLVNLFNTSDFPARWHCGNWSPGHGWLHVSSDIAIFGAYVAIPCVLAFFILRRGDVPFPKILWLFVAFIFACGFGHLIEAIIFWQPVYRFAGVIKLTTAIVSWGTVIALVQIVPQALNLPGLAKLNEELKVEVEERKRVEMALRESEGKLASLLASEREARSEAERANRSKDEFLSTVSHELRSPLNAILGYAQLLLLDDDGESEEEGLRIIERNAKLQAQIIDDLLDMSRILSGKVRLDATTVDIAQVVESAIATIRPGVNAKGIRLTSVLDPQAGPVLGDAGRLQQVICNLLTNAVKFTPKGGRIQVELERVNSHLEIRVSDTGVGIEADFLPHVFERFRQADPGTTRKYGGLGLGLSIVKYLVELHGGTVLVQSPGRDQGATFIVNLPVQAMHRPADFTDDGEPRTPALLDRLSLKGLRVLVVDDEPDTRELVKRLLCEYEAQVFTAGSMPDALTTFHRERPDLLLSDIGMPERDGYDLVRALRSLSDEDGGKTPAAALTAMARAEDRKRALVAGFQAHISKPVDAGELIAVVATLTGRTGKS
ncbi:MAG: ATP-binding protein [Pirellulaceae bacterium]|nr:ATP-binding protein [Pirellulaceae bacterium]